MKEKLAYKTLEKELQYCNLLSRVLKLLNPAMSEDGVHATDRINAVKY